MHVNLHNAKLTFLYKLPIRKGQFKNKKIKIRRRKYINNICLTLFRIFIIVIVQVAPEWYTEGIGR